MLKKTDEFPQKENNKYLKLSAEKKVWIRTVHKRHQKVLKTVIPVPRRHLYYAETLAMQRIVSYP